MRSSDALRLLLNLTLQLLNLFEKPFLCFGNLLFTGGWFALGPHLLTTKAAPETVSEAPAVGIIHLGHRLATLARRSGHQVSTARICALICTVHLFHSTCGRLLCLRQPLGAVRQIGDALAGLIDHHLVHEVLSFAKLVQRSGLGCSIAI